MNCHLFKDFWLSILYLLECCYARYNAHMAFFKRRKISIDLSRKKTVLSLDSITKSMRNMLLLVITVVALLLALHYYRKYSELRDMAQNVSPQNITNPAATAISAVEKLMLLPTNEQPVLAQVSDPKALLGNRFFRNALVGDDVLVYCKSQLSILYSPTRDKIIEVLPEALSEACKNNR